MNTQFFHVTAKNNLNDILTNGLSAGTYFTNNEELTDYYAETIEGSKDADDPEGWLRNEVKQNLPRQHSLIRIQASYAP